jgi:PTS system fructose-specific IIA component/PTS system nitrogen regulatory IIA component
MKLTDLLREDYIIDDIQSVELKDVITEMAGFLVEKGLISPDNKEEIVDSVLKREDLGSTGVGNGFAVPHAKCGDRDFIVFARSKKGVDFNALDGMPVYLIFMLVFKEDNAGQYLEGLAMVARALRSDLFRRLLLKAENVEDLWGVIVDTEKLTST